LTIGEPLKHQVRRVTLCLDRLVPRIRLSGRHKSPFGQPIPR
jgi:hypothetical protein